MIDGHMAGLILLAAALCTAMVFVWSILVDGAPPFTQSQGALNDTRMVFAFAPLVALLLGLSSITVPWDTLILSVVLYIVVPVIFAQVWRHARLAGGGHPALNRTLRALAPVSLCALLLTLVLLSRLPTDHWASVAKLEQWMVGHHPWRARAGSGGRIRMQPRRMRRPGAARRPVHHRGPEARRWQPAPPC